MTSLYPHLKPSGCGFSPISWLVTPFGLLTTDVAPYRRYRIVMAHLATAASMRNYFRALTERFLEFAAGRAAVCAVKRLYMVWDSSLSERVACVPEARRP